jgi:uncharacterized membrane protein YeiH
MFLIVLDHIGVFFFAISGLLAAGERNLDILGGYMIAYITALGGGTIRDLLLNAEIAWMGSVSIVLTIFIGAAVYLLGDYLGFAGEAWLLLTGVGIIITIRTMAVRYSWKMPLIKELDK